MWQVDHSTEWADLGETNQVKAGIEWGFTNRHIHRRRRRTRRSVDGRMHTFRDDGTTMLRVGWRLLRFDDVDEDDQRLDLDVLTREEEQTLTAAARARSALIGIDSSAREHPVVPGAGGIERPMAEWVHDRSHDR